MVTTCGIYLFSVPQSKFLLCHATRSKANMWSIPKGLKEPDESCFESAIRELFEETGIEAGNLDVRLCKELPATKYRKQNKILQSFLLATDTDLISVKLRCISLVKEGYPEIDKYKWAGIDEVEILAHESQRENMPIIKELLKSL